MKMHKREDREKYWIIKKILRIFMVIAAFVFLCWFIVPMAFYNVFNIGNILGFFVCGFCILICTFPRKVKKIKQYFYCRKGTKVLWRIGKVLIIAFYVYIGVATAAMIGVQYMPPAENATGIVLGAQVRNGRPSIVLRGRIDAADRYLQAYPEAAVIGTGGQGDDEAMSEGSCIVKDLIERGYDHTRLFTEETSVNTEENLKNAYQIIQDNGLNQNITIITDGFHQLRARIIALRAGIKGEIGACSADTHWAFIPTYYAREWLALPYELIFG